MSERSDLGASLERLMADPTPDGLWQFQKALLADRGPEAALARDDLLPCPRPFHAAA